MTDNLAEINSQEALQFYINNELDEVISDISQNHFLLKDKPKKKISKPVKTQPQIQVKPENNNFLKREVIVKKELKQIEKNSFVKPVQSLSEAISGLAKKTQGASNVKEDLSLNKIIAKAKEAALEAKNLDELKLAVENFDGCNLKKMATNTVFADGNQESKIMVIGEAPGNQEDLQGIPFCDDEGKLLDAMFNAINMSRKEDFYVANVIFWRPPGNRRPTEEELAICRPFIERHIELLDPQILILVGSTAASAILGKGQAINKVRGKFMDFSPEFLSKTIKTFAIFHPSYLMRQPSKKKIAWKDMLAIEDFLKSSEK